MSIITISRELGSWGTDIAHKVAKDMHFKYLQIVWAGLACFLAAVRPAWAAEDSLLAWWGFEETAGGFTLDRVSEHHDTIVGYFRLVAGPSGRALKCDGFTTCVTRTAQDAPRLGDAFTMQAWVAVQAYPWGWCPIVTQREGRESGYLFAIIHRCFPRKKNAFALELKRPVPILIFPISILISVMSRRVRAWVYP